MTAPLAGRPVLIDLRMADGSRNFGTLPETLGVDVAQWYALREHVAALPGATLTGFVTDDVTEAWIDFTYGGHAFSLNDQAGDWWFFVADPACPDALLEAVLDHFARVLAPTRGAFEAVVFEASGRVSRRAFAHFVEARAYADDAAWETEDGPVAAHVVDEAGTLVHVGGRGGVK